MEFHEKLQELRKKRNMTQEELAEALYVSRTAVSKWESGRGYPNIDSLKELSAFFQISIDDLLSGNVLLSIAEKDNHCKMQRTYCFLASMIDVSSFMLIILPLYPKAVGGYVYSISLIDYAETGKQYLFLYWTIYLALIIIGIASLILLKYQKEKSAQILSDISIGCDVMGLVFMVVCRETYAAVFLVIMLAVKIMMKDRIHDHKI